jgi:hypothetical protein
MINNNFLDVREKCPIHINNLLFKLHKKSITMHPEKNKFIDYDESAFYCKTCVIIHNKNKYVEFIWCDDENIEFSSIKYFGRESIILYDLQKEIIITYYEKNIKLEIINVLFENKNYLTRTYRKYNKYNINYPNNKIQLVDINKIIRTTKTLSFSNDINEDIKNMCF